MNLHEHNHQASVIKRHCDVAIIGASAAGLAAGLQLGRQRRSVIVIDSDEPRNAPAAHMHSYLGHEGVSPAQLAALGREEVRSYGGEVIMGRAVDVTRTESGFCVELTGGHLVTARRVLAATGLVDELPDIDGLAQHWGRDVIHCPFCHGYEVRDQRVVQIITHPMGLHPAALFRQLTAQFTVVLHEGVSANHLQLEVLRASGVTVVAQQVRRIVADNSGRIKAVELAGGDQIAADAVVVGTRFLVRAQMLASLGVTPAVHPTGLGDFIEINQAGETLVSGLYAAGNVTDPSQQVLQAAAQGSWVGGMIAFSLAAEDLEQHARPSGNQADWEHRYSGLQIWSGNPNGALVHEVSAMTPGRALDVGVGEGGDAVWLAEQGWLVTASDISPLGLNRIAGVANERDLAIACHQADANAIGAYGTEKFDLVSAHYASIPRTPDQRGVNNVVRAVALGGTLLVVSHDIEAMRKPPLSETTSGSLNEVPLPDRQSESRPFDPDAYVRVEDFATVITNDSNWTIETYETRARPPGASTHHVNDIVLRAKRRSE